MLCFRQCLWRELNCRAPHEQLPSSREENQQHQLNTNSNPSQFLFSTGSAAADALGMLAAGAAAAEATVAAASSHCPAILSVYQDSGFLTPASASAAPGGPRHHALDLLHHWQTCSAHHAHGVCDADARSPVDSDPFHADWPHWERGAGPAPA